MIGMASQMISTAFAGLAFVALATQGSFAQQVSAKPENPLLMANASLEMSTGAITRIGTVSPDSTVWLAPIGHRQPHRADVPAVAALDPYFGMEDALVDRKISGICKGC